jgi:hypothetical protein
VVEGRVWRRLKCCITRMESSAELGFDSGPDKKI